MNTKDDPDLSSLGEQQQKKKKYFPEKVKI
jgi:hypothetical protein